MRTISSRMVAANAAIMHATVLPPVDSMGGGIDAVA